MKRVYLSLFACAGIGLLLTHQAHARKTPRIYGSVNRTACLKQENICAPLAANDASCDACERLHAARCNPYKRFWGGKGTYYPQARQRVGTWLWGWPHRPGVGYFYEGTGANSRW